jgi:hypothetical protein
MLLLGLHNLTFFKCSHFRILRQQKKCGHLFAQIASAGDHMIFISFLISYIGFFAIKSVDPRILQILFANFNPSLGMILFFSFVVSLCGAFFSLSLMNVWICLSILILSATQFEKILRWKRKSKLKIHALKLLDELVLTLKAGGHLKQAVETAQKSNESWFQGFSLELKKCLELENSPNTESKWFNTFICEVVEIQKSRVKTVDQLIALRRSIRSEVKFEKKSEQVLSGPRFQMKFMILMFLALNVIFISNHQEGQTLKLLLPAWILFLLGIIVSRFLTRRVKWKI